MTIAKSKTKTITEEKLLQYITYIIIGELVTNIYSTTCYKTTVFIYMHTPQQNN